MKAKGTVKTKIATCSIIGVILAGTALILGVADLAGQSILSKVFFFFLGAVIVVQVIPGLMLFAAMLKGVYSLFSKKAKAPVEESAK